MPTLDLSDDELQAFINICAHASGPGITWMVCNGLLMKAQQAAQAKMPLQTETIEYPPDWPRSDKSPPEKPAYDATTRPLEPPHRRRANSEDR